MRRYPGWAKAMCLSDIAASHPCIHALWRQALWLPALPPEFLLNTTKHLWRQSFCVGFAEVPSCHPVPPLAFSILFKLVSPRPPKQWLSPLSTMFCIGQLSPLGRFFLLGIQETVLAPRHSDDFKESTNFLCYPALLFQIGELYSLQFSVS